MHGVQNAAALRVRFGDELQSLDRGDGLHERAGLAVEDRIRAATRVDGEEPVARHARDLLAEHARSVDDERRAKRAAVGMYGGDPAVLHVHAGHGGVERDVRAVGHGVFRVGNREPVGAHAAGVRV